MFVGRKKELITLEEIYQKNGFGMCVIYGRRRIGKSTLIAEFVKNKKTIFYTATKIGSKRNQELFARQVLEIIEPQYIDAEFPNIESIFDIITEKIGDEKIVLVIDELPYWVESDNGLLSIIQKYIDTKWQNKKIMLILCGSALSFMENKVLSEKSPLFGRRDSQIKLEPFNYKESADFFPNYSYEEKALCYGITGGVAKYLTLFDNNKSLDDNIKRLFFTTDGYLFDETKNLLTQEFNDITLVNNIIEQMAVGENTLNNIATKVREKESTVLYSLEKLIEVGLVERRRCITEESNKKKTQYVLKDGMFRFWYQFIPKAYSVIEIGQGEKYFEKIVKPQIHSYMGSIFEEMCKYYTFEKGIENKFGYFITNVSTYWGQENIVDEFGNKRYQPFDIDVVAISSSDKVALVGECKYKNEKIDKNVYETLKRRASIINNKYQVKRYLLFSLSGFSEWFKTSKLNDVSLITLSDLYE